MKKALCRCRTEILGQDARGDDAQAVGKNGNGQGREDEDHPVPGLGVQHKGVGRSKGQQGHDGPQAAAGVGYLQGDVGKHEDIAFLPDYDAKCFHAQDRDLGHKKLQRKGRRIVDDVGDGHHE